MIYKNILLKISLLGVLFSFFSTNLLSMDLEKIRLKKEQSKRKIDTILRNFENDLEKIRPKLIKSFRLVYLFSEDKPGYVYDPQIYKNKETLGHLEKEMENIGDYIYSKIPNIMHHLNNLNAIEKAIRNMRLEKIINKYYTVSSDLYSLKRTDCPEEVEQYMKAFSYRYDRNKSRWKEVGNITINMCEHESNKKAVITDENTCSLCEEEKRLKEQKRIDKENGVDSVEEIDSPLDDLENINRMEENNPVELDLPDNDDNETNSNSYFWPATKITLGVSCIILAALFTTKFFSATN